MKKGRVVSIIVLAVLLVLTLGSSGLAQTTIAIMPLEEGQISDWYLPRQQMVDGITQLLTDKLAELDGVTVVERSRMTHILDEQDFGRSGRVDSYTAAQIGRMLGARLLLTGTITELSHNDAGYVQLGAFRLRADVGTVGLSVRVVDVETGEVRGSMQASGQHTGSSISISNVEGLSFSSSTFKNSVLGKAVEKAVQDLVNQFEEKLVDWETPPETQRGAVGRVMAIVGHRYIINLGSLDGVNLHDRFEVFELVDVEGISLPVEVPLGTLRIISVDPEAAVAEEEAGGPFYRGNRVRKQ